MDQLLSTPKRWMLTALGLAIAGCYLFPVYWMYASSLKPSFELNASPPTLVPHAPTFAAYAWIFTRENMARYMGNSLVIASAVTALSLVLATGAAYALSRVRSFWMDAVLVGIMLSQVLPPALLATPMFVIFRQIDLINTQTAVVLATTTKTLPFAVVMLRTTFAQIPVELEEAARVDGCTRLSAFLRITLPVARIGYIVVGTLVFLLAYGEFVYPVSLVNKNELQPATVGLYGFVGADYSDWGNAMAFASVVVTPVILVFVLLQRRIVSGLTAGAIK
ncbi:carbohydrate ABC transporter permease [uncultured Alsobacter sp.]|uniref:carbohydrate ABC transporter permease n=1 Tax=uncultured Alsobacter sp. TaxID=1748258 RepID=UPI0025F7172D|nr:carbohydrate ABC transporter permease [uncultured Alsobacter sp.]